MTNKEKAQALMASVMDRSNDDAQRRSDLDALQALKRSAKTSYEKLGVSDAMVERELEALAHREAVAADMASEDFVDPLDEEPLKIVGDKLLHADGRPVEGVASVTYQPAGDKPKPKSDTKGDQRGLISAMVRCELMDTTDSYAAIVERVKAKYPNANTTTRSVASVASDLRKDGVAIASRRPAKGGQ